MNRMAREQFVEAIGSQKVRDWVAYKDPRTLDEAVHMAIKVEAREDRKNGKGGIKKVVYAVQPAKPEKGEEERGNDQSTETKCWVDEIKRDMSKLRNDMQNMMQNLNTNRIPMQNQNQNRPAFRPQGPRQDRNAPRTAKDLRCYRCNNLGHMMRDCTVMNQRTHEYDSPRYPNRNQGN